MNKNLNSTEPVLIKKPYQKLRLNDHQMQEYARCMMDPVYFVQNYVYVQHPVLGKVRFDLYEYQVDLLKTYNGYRQVIAMCSRQLGKCVVADTQVTKDDSIIPIETLVKLGFKDRLINSLEKLLLKLSRMR